MKIIYNNVIPFKGFVAINLFGVLFVRREYRGRVTARTLNHEAIHSAQMRELFYVGFYVWYLVEWIVRLFGRGNAYRNVSFEREAYGNERDHEYLNKRKGYAFLGYYRKKGQK